MESGSLSHYNRCEPSRQTKFITMNSTAPSSIFGAIAMAPRDPILGITEAFNADTNAAKINLGVGVYYDDNGKVPLLECVRKAEAKLMEQPAPRTYLPIEGLAAYDKAVQELVFGADSPVIQEKRAITVQALGGTGALKIGADFLKRFAPDSAVYISDPSWENHRALFESAGFTVNNYAYYDPATHGVNFDAMPEGAIVLLHACCHNPTGADLTADQWGQVIDVVTQNGLIPFLDMAYQGFGSGIAEDGAVVRRFTEAGGPLLVSNSFSKSFSLYGERVGALSIVGATGEEAARLMSRPMAARSSRPCWPRRNCVSCGKTSWPACACASRKCARRWSRNWPRKHRPATSSSCASRSACSRIRA
jgi:aromatic-amino-acid transaminase